MGVTLLREKKSSLIRLEGTVDISFAAELKTILLEALERGNAMEVTFDDAATLDVTAVQLLWAAAREAKASGLMFAFAEQVPEPLSTALREVGLDGIPVSA